MCPWCAGAAACGTSSARRARSTPACASTAARAGQPGSSWSVPLSPQHCTAVLQADLRRVGWQLLTALRFLQDRGLAHGNLHAGNIVLEGEQVMPISGNRPG